MINFFAKFKYFDLPLQITTGLLIFIGLAVLYSTVLPVGPTTIFWKQLAFLVLSLFLYFFFCFFDYHAFAKAGRFIYPIFIVILTYLLVLGTHVRGGRRWINFGFFSFQPAEFIKIIIILILARWFTLHRGLVNSWRHIILSFLIIAIPIGLIVLEPDLGSALVILGIWAGMLLISPIKKKFLLILLICFLAFSGVTWKYFLKDFQRDRVLVFINPALDPQGRGYNVRQAIIAIGSGKLLGRGLGNGLQGQQKFLPEQQTDFIFASGAEEVGFLGATVILALYAYFLFRLTKIIRNARDDLGMYIAGGVFFFFFIHIVINIGVNLGMLPVTGIPLLFFSAGGSSLVVALMSLGIVQNVVMQSKVLRF